MPEWREYSEEAFFLQLLRLHLLPSRRDATSTPPLFLHLFTSLGNVGGMESHRAEAEVITIDSDDDDLEVTPYLNPAANYSIVTKPPTDPGT